MVITLNQKMIFNTAVIESLHRLGKDEYRGTIDRLSHRWGKCVDSAGDYIV
jgi:hypothetical protein